MKLPNLNTATVPQAKITQYLLSSTHESGKGKAGFFTHFGFSVEEWHELAKALLQHAAENEVAKVEDSPFGRRYVIEGEVPTPDRRTPMVRAVWFIDNEQEVPRFVTAYPLKREGDDR
jgi:hypothetical protein